MDLKKLTGKLMTVVASGAMVMSIGGGVVWANNCKVVTSPKFAAHESK